MSLKYKNFFFAAFHFFESDFLFLHVFFVFFPFLSSQVRKIDKKANEITFLFCLQERRPPFLDSVDFTDEMKGAGANHFVALPFPKPAPYADQSIGGEHALAGGCFPLPCSFGESLQSREKTGRKVDASFFGAWRMQRKIFFILIWSMQITFFQIF
jgi:hypothetical protein